MKYVLFFLSIFFSCGLMAQGTIKLTQLEKGIASGSPVGGLVGVTRVSDGKQRYMTYVNVADNCINFSPKATGNTLNLNNFVQKCSSDSVWYIDYEGRSIFLGKVNTNGGGSGTADRDWLEITTNATPDSIGDAIYTYNYAAIGANLKWPNAEFFVNDSASAAVAIAQGNRVAGWSCYNRLNGSWTRFGHDGNVSLITADPTAQKLFIQAAGSGTVDNPGGPFTTRMEIDFATGGIRFNAYPQTRNDTGISPNFLGTDNLGNVVSNPLADVPVSGGLTGTLGSNIVSDNSIGTDQVVDGSILPDDLVGDPIGNIGDVLTVGASGVPEWAAPTGGGGGGIAVAAKQIPYGTGTGVTSTPAIYTDTTNYYLQPQRMVAIGDTTVPGNTRLESLHFRNRWGVPGGLLRGKALPTIVLESPTQTTESKDFMFLQTNPLNQVYPGPPGTGCTNCPADSTRNEVVKWGFNIDGSQKNNQHGIWYAMEPNWYNGGQLWTEMHLEAYLPGFISAPFLALYPNKGTSRRLFTTEIQNIKVPELATNSWSYCSDGFVYNSLKSYSPYISGGFSEVSKNGSLSIFGGRGGLYGVTLSADSVQNLTQIGRVGSVSPSTSSFAINGYNRCSMVDNTGKSWLSYIGAVNELRFGNSTTTTDYFFQGSNFNGGQRVAIVGDMTSSLYTSRRQLVIGNATNSKGMGIGFRTDNNFGFMTGETAGLQTPISMSFTKFSLNRTLSNARPTGTAFLNIYTEQANTIPAFNLQTSTDSVKVFVASTTPESSVTSNPGSLVLSTSGNAYLKTSGVGNTGWTTVLSGWKGIATLNFPSVSAQSVQSLTLTVTGCAIGDAVQVVDPSIFSGSIVFSGKVTASNTVTVYASNITSGSLDPASGDFNVIVTKF